MQTRKVVTFLSVLSTSLLFAAQAFAEGTTAEASGDSGTWAKYFAIALAIAIPAAGGALGQGRTAAAALDGIARNPNATSKIFTPMILGLALIESLVIYGLLIALILVFS